MSPLHSSLTCVEHAKLRTKEIETEIDAFIATNPYAYVVDVDPDGSKDFHKVKLTKQPPRKIAMIAFETVNVLRSALDQAGHAVAKGAGHTGRYAKFPFGDSLVNVQSLHARGSKQLPKEIFDLMVASRPYSGGNDLLWAINHLANTNKHDFIVPAVAIVGDFFSGNLKVPGQVYRMGFPPQWDGTKNEMEIAVVPHGGEVQCKLQFGMSVALADIQCVSRLPAPAALVQMTNIVEGLLVAIESEGRRIGVF